MAAYLCVKSVKTKVRSLNRQVGRGFIEALERIVDNAIMVAYANAGSFKTLRPEDLNSKVQIREGGTDGKA